MSETFFSRWSRRKQEVRTSEPAPEDAGPAEAGDAGSQPAAQMAVADDRGEEPAASAELSADDIAALPSLEDLTAETDISVFLRKGVPESLRNAALRRMWSLDPKIRDFLCEAREYAYDWNTPGGVPGYGPLPTTEEVVRMAARIVGGGAHESAGSEGDRADDAAQGGSQYREPLLVSADESDAVAAAPHAPLIIGEGLGDAAANCAMLPPPPASVELAETAGAATVPQSDRPDEPAGPPSRRRHGGAVPV